MSGQPPERREAPRPRRRGPLAFPGGPGLPSGPLVLASLAVLQAFAGGGPGPAAAAPEPARAGEVHTALEAASPGEGARVERPVTEIRLRFTTEVQAALSSITLRGPSGVVASTEEPGVVTGSGGQELRLPLEDPLPGGAYTVEWRTAGPDSHPIEGRYDFRVQASARTPDTADDTARSGAAGGDTAAGGPPGALEPDAEGAGRPGAVSIAIRWLFFLSILGMVGTVATRAVVLTQISRDDELAVAVPRAVRGTWILAAVAAGLGVLALPARLWLQSVSLFSGGALSASNLSDLLFRSPWGAGWFLEAACAAVFILGILGARPGGTRKRGWFLMALAAAGMCVVPGLSGHAWGAVDQRAPALAADALHVLAAGVWMGGLGTLVLAGLPAVRAVGGKEALPRLLPALVSAFSRMAMAGVGLLVATGVVNAWLRLDSLSQLLYSAYGRTLLVKLAVVAGALALGFYNWRVVRPSLRESPSPGLIRIPATLEFILGLIVLAVTAALVATGLPG